MSSLTISRNENCLLFMANSQVLYIWAIEARSPHMIDGNDLAYIVKPMHAITVTPCQLMLDAGNRKGSNAFYIDIRRAEDILTALGLPVDEFTRIAVAQGWDQILYGGDK